MIIFGASGDLTKRKLMPALYSLYREKRLTGEFSILGIGRTVYSDDNYRSYILEELQQFVKSEEQDTALMASFVSHLYYLPMDPAKEEGYPQLRQRLVDLTGEVDPDLTGLYPIKHLQIKNWCTGSVQWNIVIGHVKDLADILGEYT